MSDDEEQFNAKSHQALLDSISNLSKVQHIRKSTRTEPQRQQSEFTLASIPVTRADISGTTKVGVGDVVQILKKTSKHIDAGKQLKKVQKTNILKRPLEKPAADRIKRTIGYENVKKQLSRWDAVVTKNRSAETQIFPLKGETIYVDTSAFGKPIQPSLKSKLMLEMEETDNRLKQMKRELVGDDIDEEELEKREKALLEKKLTRDELIARRRELAYLKVRQSQQSAKARMQNKIKSKKYRKLLKRQKLQEQIKQFEMLQKTNPEAALEKLNELEKSRVLERASLRHKNTGSWAKNLQVRAKYDRDVRKDLAEQLQISRELTQQRNNNESDDNEELEMENKSGVEPEDEEDNDPFNPWARIPKKQEAVGEVESKSNYRQYWLERNKNEKLLQEYRKSDVAQKSERTGSRDSSEEYTIEVSDVKVQTQSGEVASKSKHIKKKKLKSVTKIQKNIKKIPTIENGWIVEEIKPIKTKHDINIDDLFDAKEDEIRRQLGQKLKVLSDKVKRLSKTNKTKYSSKAAKDALSQLKDLSFKNQLKRPIIDEELNYNALDEDRPSAAEELANATANGDASPVAVATNETEIEAIDPNKVATVKLKQNLYAFNTVDEAVGDVNMEMDDDFEAEKQMTISEAFEDDDIVADFTKEKDKDTELKDVEINLSMPGWGSWAGAGISPEEQAKRRNNRLVLKLAAEQKRRDENKDNVYINEESCKTLRGHLVSDLPFPFTSVQEYEASIRAPIGRNYVTETAFRMLTRPSVIAAKGKIIEPMDESELVKKPRKLLNEVDKRIQAASKVKTKGK